MGNSDLELFGFKITDNFGLIFICGGFVLMLIVGALGKFLEGRKKALRNAYRTLCPYCGARNSYMNYRSSSKDHYEFGLRGTNQSFMDRKKTFVGYKCASCGKEHF